MTAMLLSSLIIAISPNTSSVVALTRGEAPHCSGTIVAPRVVLTAAHCLPATLVLEGTDPLTPTSKHRVVATERTPDIASDLALLILETPTQTHSLEFRTPSTNLATHVAGFGINKEKRQLLHRITFPRPLLFCDTARAEVTGCIAGEAVLLPSSEGDTCAGDSGGPALQVSANQTFIVALTSRSIRGQRACGAGGIYVLLTPHLKWIGEIIQGATP